MAKQYNLDYKPGEDALQYYRRLAKVADQRLVRLERLTETEGYENVTAYAYARAQRDISRYTEGHRFNTKPPLKKDGTVDYKLLKEKTADIKTFLSSVTSTKAGITATFEKRVKTINKKYETDYTWQELADLFQSGDFEKFSDKYGSDTVYRALAKIRAAESKVLKGMDGNTKKQLNNVDTLVAKEMLNTKKAHIHNIYTKEERSLLIEELNKDLR